MTDPNERSTSCSFQDLIFNMTQSLINHISTANARLNRYSSFLWSILAFRSHLLIPCILVEKLLPGMILSLIYIRERESSRLLYWVFEQHCLHFLVQSSSNALLSGVYFVIEPITEQLPKIDYNTDAIPNLVYGTKIEFLHANAHLSGQRTVNFIKHEICNTRVRWY